MSWGYQVGLHSEPSALLKGNKTLRQVKRGIKGKGGDIILQRGMVMRFEEPRKFGESHQIISEGRSSEKTGPGSQSSSGRPQAGGMGRNFAQSGQVKVIYDKGKREGTGGG